MRLLNSRTGEMRHFISYAEIPAYAILSHTWGEDEVTFQDWLTLPRSEVRKMKGFQKIDYCCQQAVKDGLEWTWVDTCCIDKTSSAELTESINSMFRWYKSAAVCYAYLPDVPKDLDKEEIEEELANSRWFTRGWTLQELIAPSTVVFYSAGWQQIGTKAELSSCIAAITGIEETYLDAANIDRASVAQRMSWASRRQTSRDEDIAYCLLGIFDVNMPLIYGEGPKAFQRLQEEIMKAYPEDHTLFAWGKVVTQFSKHAQGENQLNGLEPLSLREKSRQDDDEDDEDEDEDDESLLGFLAQSPHDFKQSGKFICYREAKKFFRRWDFPLTAPTIVGRTTRLDLPLVGATPPFAVCRLDESLPIFRLRRVSIVVLVCGRQDEVFKYVTIPLLICTGGFYGRTREVVVNELISTPSVHYDLLGRWRSQIVVERQPRYRPSAGDIILRRFVTHVPCATSIAIDEVDVSIDDGVIKARSPPQPGHIVCLTFEYSKMAGFGLAIARMDRVDEGGGDLGSLHFSLMTVDVERDEKRAKEWSEAEQARYDRQLEKDKEPEHREVVEVKGDESDGDDVGHEYTNYGSGGQYIEKGGRRTDSPERKGGIFGNRHHHHGGKRDRLRSWASSAITAATTTTTAVLPLRPTPPRPSSSSSSFTRARSRSPRPQPPWARPRFRDGRQAYYYLWDNWKTAPHRHAMAYPSDTWEMTSETAAAEAAEASRAVVPASEAANSPYYEPDPTVPTVRIVAERMYIDNDRSQPVDIIDIVIRAPGEPLPGRPAPPPSSSALLNGVPTVNVQAPAE